VNVRAPLAASAVVLVTIAAGCGGHDRPLVLAASSLSDALPEMAVGVDYSFGGSDHLVAQMRAGAPADMIVTADPAILQGLREDGLVGAPVMIATNRLVLAVRADATGIHSIADIPRHDTRLALAAPGVPAGRLARELLERLGRDDLTNGALTHEDSVRSVLGLITMGEADAGIVYATDARAARRHIRVVPLPPGASPVAHYAAAVANPDGSEGRRLLSSITSARARRLLAQAGFGPP